MNKVTEVKLAAMRDALKRAEAASAAGDKAMAVRAQWLRSEIAKFSSSALPAATKLPNQETSEGFKSLAKQSTQDSKPRSKQDSQPIFSKGSAQVPLLCDKASHSNELNDVPSHNLAGSSPHAPDRRRRERRKGKDVKGSVLNIRMPATMKAKLEAKAALLESYPSAYVLKLVAADLCLPIDEAQLARSRGLQEEIATLTTALNRLGNNFNQIAKNANEGKPSPLSRSEVSELLRHHTKAIAHLLKLGFA